MGKALEILKKKREDKHALSGLFKNPENVFVVHYACESFAQNQSPRITAIAVRNLANGQTKTFSFYLIADKMQIALNQLEQHYNVIEKELLSEFFEFVRLHQKHKWLHWNMRDANYGFDAIGHRFEVLGGTPILPHESNIIDLSRILISIYGVGYIEHPRLENIIKLNDITNKDFICGNEEPEAFRRKKFHRIDLSVLRKVDVLAGLAERANNSSLKTKRYYREMYLVYPEALVEFAKEHPLVSVIIGIVAFVGSICSIYAVWK